MSQENVELIRGLTPDTPPDLVQVFREDAELGARIHAAIESRFHPDFECVRHDIPGGEPHFGFDGLRTLYLDWLAPWVEYRTAVNEFLDCGERVLTLQHSWGRLDGSTHEVTVDLATVWTVRSGRVVRWEIYPSHASALKAVGLEE